MLRGLCELCPHPPPPAAGRRYKYKVPSDSRDGVEVDVDVDDPSLQRRFCCASTGFIAAAGLVLLLIVSVAVAVPLVVLKVAGGQPACGCALSGTPPATGQLTSSLAAHAGGGGGSGATMPALLASNGTDRSSAQGGAVALRSAAGCAVLTFTSDGGLALYHDPSSRSSSSTSSSAALAWRSPPAPAAAAAPTTAFTLQLGADGMLATSSAAGGDSEAAVIWSNGLSQPFDGPFQLAIRCNASWAALEETDASGAAVWRSDLAAAQQQAPQFSGIEGAEEELPDDFWSGFLQRVDPSAQPGPVLPGARPGDATATADVDVSDDSIRADLQALLRRNGTAAATPAARPPPSPPRRPPPARPLGHFPQQPVMANAIPHEAQMVYLDNGKLRLGFDLARGAALSYLAAHPQLEQNLVNAWDTGRMVQQSYYGSTDGSIWAVPEGRRPWRCAVWGLSLVGGRRGRRWRLSAGSGLARLAAAWQGPGPQAPLQPRLACLPLARATCLQASTTGRCGLAGDAGTGAPAAPQCRYNPVQGGAYTNEPSKVVAWRVDNASRCFASQVTPRHWASGKLLADATMWQTICLKRDVIKMAFSMKFTGKPRT